MCKSESSQINKAKPSRLIPWKLPANFELLIITTDCKQTPTLKMCKTFRPLLFLIQAATQWRTHPFLPQLNLFSLKLSLPWNHAGMAIPRHAICCVSSNQATTSCRFRGLLNGADLKNTHWHLERFTHRQAAQLSGLNFSVKASSRSLPWAKEKKALRCSLLI